MSLSFYKNETNVKIQKGCQVLSGKFVRCVFKVSTPCQNESIQDLISI